MEGRGFQIFVSFSFSLIVCVLCGDTVIWTAKQSGTVPQYKTTGGSDAW